MRTASATFYARGINTVGVEAIVSEAGVTRATFYRHFPSKEDLIVAVGRWEAWQKDTPLLARSLALFLEREPAYRAVA